MPSRTTASNIATSVGSKPEGPFIFQNLRDVRAVYDIDEAKIGEGTFGVVRSGRHRATGVSRAIKSVPKGNNAHKLDALRREIHIMKAMDHPHIIQLFETFEDRRYIYLAMELCSGGELFDKIIAAKCFSEAQAAIIMKQILRSVFYMHDNSFVHRDLKPENYLFQNKEPIESNSLKLIDFGTATECPAGKTLKTKIGTLMYMAPQVMMGRYDRQCDMWSVGVILFILLSGEPPFNDRTDEGLILKVRTGKLAFASETWNDISDDAKDLIRNLIRMDAKQRFSAGQALNNEWVKMQAPRAVESQLREALCSRLHKFRNGLEKAALRIVAGQLNEEQIRDLNALFDELDENGDGKVSAEELSQGLARAGFDMSSREAKQMVEYAEATSSGALNYSEFLAAAMNRKKVLTQDVLWTAFNVFDKNGDGVISKPELKAVLCNGSVQNAMSQQMINELMREVDTDGSGGIDFEEFMHVVRGKSGLVRGQSDLGKQEASRVSSERSLSAAGL